MSNLIAEWGYKDGKPTYRAVNNGEPQYSHFIVEERNTDAIGGDSWRKTDYCTSDQFTSLIRDLIRYEQVLTRRYPATTTIPELKKGKKGKKS
jgi:hypothetical protein